MDFSHTGLPMSAFLRSMFTLLACAAAFGCSEANPQQELVLLRAYIVQDQDGNQTGGGANFWLGVHSGHPTLAHFQLEALTETVREAERLNGALPPVHLYQGSSGVIARLRSGPSGDLHLSRLSPGESSVETPDITFFDGIQVRDSPTLGELFFFPFDFPKSLLIEELTLSTEDRTVTFKVDFDSEQLIIYSASEDPVTIYDQSSSVPELTYPCGHPPLTIIARNPSTQIKHSTTADFHADLIQHLTIPQCEE